MPSRRSLAVLVWLAPLLWLAFAGITLVCGLSVLIAYPFVRPFDRARHSLHAIAIGWARAICYVIPGLRYEIVGAENMAPNGKAAVYVANHQSQTDILALFLTGARFRWLAKAELFRIPVFGWALKAIGYVPVVRTSRRSRAQCMKDALAIVRSGIPMMFFPEGTRSEDGVLKAFKPGAFTLAVEAGVPIIPITIQGTDTFLPKGSVIPHGSNFRVVIHAPLAIQGRSAVELVELARAAIASDLPTEKRGLVQPAAPRLAAEGVME